MIDVTLLGVSALLPTPERALTAAVLRCGGRTILFDCGEGTQTAARKAGVSLMKTDLIALTHYHGDHIFGLPGLLQTMGSMRREEPLYITGPEGLEAAMTPILQLTGWVPFEIRLLHLPLCRTPLTRIFPHWEPNAAIEPFPTLHRVPSRGYAFTLARSGRFDPDAARALGVPLRLWGALQRGEAVEAQGRRILPSAVTGAPRRGLKFVFSGDTAPCDALCGAARDADLLICEATYAENDQKDAAAEYGHMTFAAAGETAAKAGVRRLWLSHFSQSIADPNARLENAAAFFPAAECGEDGKTIRLKFTE